VAAHVDASGVPAVHTKNVVVGSDTDARNWPMSRRTARAHCEWTFVISLVS
jgi:hypothetical protein